MGVSTYIYFIKSFFSNLFIFYVIFTSYKKNYNDYNICNPIK